MTDATQPRVPTFLVAGAARAGTTGLVEGLRGHPRVFVTDPKEPHYLALHDTRPDFRGPGDDRLVNSVAVTSEAAYRALFPADAAATALGEGSVSTLYLHQRAIPEIRRLNPDVKIVILLREPVSRAFSSFQYLRTLGVEDQEDFLAAVALEPQRIAENWHHLWHYTAMSRYADAVSAFLAQFPPGQVGVWFYDDLQRDYADTLRRVLQFLQLPAVAGEGEHVPRVNASGALRYPAVHKSIWWATRQPALRHAVRGLSSFRFREAVRAKIITRGDVPEAVRAALDPVFADDLTRLRSLLPGDVPLWLSNVGT